MCKERDVNANVLRTRRAGSLTYIIRPNQSLTWRQASVAYAGISTLILAVGTGCYLLFGLGLVLPFSGAEVFLLGVGFYACYVRSGYQEVITISRDKVIVEAGRARPEQRYEFNRYWLKIRLEKPTTGSGRSRLLLGSHGRVVEIGAVLRDEDRDRFAKELEATIKGPQSAMA